MKLFLSSIIVSVAALALVSGRGVQAQVPGESGPDWHLAAQILQGYSSNVLLTTTHPVGDETTSLMLELGRVWAGPHWSFSATYLPERQMYLHNHNLDFVSQAYQQAWTWAPSRHTSLSWTANVARYPERAGAPEFSGGGIAGVTASSQTAAMASLLTTGTSGFSLNHQYSLRGSWSAGVSGSLQRFSTDAALSQELAAGSTDWHGTPTQGRNQALSATANWSYELTPQRSVELGTTVADFWLTNPNQHRRNASAQISMQQQFGGGWGLQAGAGPAWNWALTPGLVASGQVLSGLGYAAHAGLEKASGFGVYGLSWQHALQPSLVPGGLTSDSLSLMWQRQWSRGWSTSTSLGQSRFTGVASGLNPQSPPRTMLFASAGLRWASAHWALAARARYDNQDLPGTAPAAGLQQLRRVQGSLSFSYHSQGAH